MNPVRLALGAIAVCLAMPAAAVVSKSYDFTNEASFTSPSNLDTWSNANPSFYNAASGTNYGNVRTFMSSGTTQTPVNVSAWGSTGGVGGFNGKLQSGYVGVYGANDLGVTSPPISGNTELNSSHQPNTGNNQHAIDNQGGYESLLFSFQSSVTLDSVSIGFPSSGSGLDSDATVLVYTGSGNPTPNLSMRTYADLVADGGGWEVASNLFNMSTSAATNVGTTKTSKYWMVGAFMNLGGNSQIHGNDTAFDTIKINGITVTPKLAVTEPGSLALIGIASLGLVVRRRGIARTV